MEYEVMEFIENAGSVIRAIRKEKGMTQAQVAKMLNIHHVAQCMMERQKKRCSIGFLAFVFDKLGYSLMVKVVKK